MRCVFDIEANGLLMSATKVHCCSFFDIDTKELLTLTAPGDIIAKLNEAELLIGFNAMGYDLPLLHKLHGLSYHEDAERVADLWEIAVTLNPNRLNSVEAWASRLGMDGKIHIDDWENLPVERYIARSEQDVRIEYEIYKVLMKECEVNDYGELWK